MKEIVNKVYNWYEENKASAISIIIYLFICLISSIIMFASFNVRNGLMALCFMSFSILLILGTKILKFKLKPIFTILVLMLAFGGLSGTIFELYIIIPWFDNFLHGLSGFLFAILGFTLMKHFVGNRENKRNFIGCLTLGICLSLAIAVVWELFEYSATFLGFDMLEDTIVNHFDSYLLAGTHNEVVSVNDITQTVIYFGNGETITINGYLDIGIIDTINDMLICTIGAICFSMVATISYYKFPKINELLIPNIVNKENNY